MSQFNSQGLIRLYFFGEKEKNIGKYPCFTNISNPIGCKKQKLSTFLDDVLMVMDC